MEKFIFFASLKTKLSELNIPQPTIEKHIKVFEECFAGKTGAEIDAIIDGAGGLDGIINSVYKLEEAKANRMNPPSAITEQDDSLSETRLDTPVATAKNNPVSENEAEPKENAPDASVDEFADNGEPKDENTSDEKSSEDNINEEVINDESVEKSDDIDEHIREAEEITKEIDKVVIENNNTSEENAEFADDFDEYDFEVLFAEKISKPEKWAIALRSKMSEKTYKNTLPLAYFVDGLIFLIVSLLFPLLFASAVVVAVAYIAILVAGITFALVPLGYGAYMSFKIKPIGTYEIALGVLILGFTMLSSILLYNYMKRLVPYLFKKLKELFKLCILATKRYFTKTKKEEE